ncbi:MAG: DUF4440 domain-containing protein [candidate division Zixibacteria bacterium]|nr:DUF4440 domain-containing protein [candidate division Zixibacteria bacterium]
MSSDVDKTKLIEVDREFSQMSSEHGIAKAFVNYAADSAIILSENRLPIVGRTAIGDMWADVQEGAQLIWEPDFADIAASGELGYTIGHWTYSVTDSSGETQSSKGRYVTIWKKQADGNWKYVFDSGTTDPEETE